MAFPALYRSLGVTAAIATFAPVLAAGWWFGERWGAATGLLTIPLNGLAFWQLGITYADEPLRSGLLPGTLGWVTVGYLVGSARQLARRHASQAESLVVALDERTRAEESLRAERDRYEMLLEAQSALGEAVVLGRGERIEWANDALLAATGHSLDTVRALGSIFDLVEPDARRVLRAALADRGGRGHVTTALRADGTTFPVELAVRSIRLDGGERGFLLVARDITERAEADRILRRHADEDALTGLANRRQVELHLGTLLQQGPTGVALLFIDLDGFKAVNDEHGHNAGDAVLRIVARRVLGQIREGDVAGRLGGDEFVVVAQGTSRENADELAARLDETLRRPLRVGDVECAISASIGVAIAPADGVTAVTLLQAADRAMYRAKRTRAGVG